MDNKEIWNSVLIEMLKTQNWHFFLFLIVIGVNILLGELSLAEGRTDF